MRATKIEDSYKRKAGSNQILHLYISTFKCKKRFHILSPHNNTEK